MYVCWKSYFVERIKTTAKLMWIEKVKRVKRIKITVQLMWIEKVKRVKWIKNDIKIDVCWEG